jgi:hypothetical protein
VKERLRPAPLDLDHAEALHRQGQRRAGAGILLGFAALCTLIAVVIGVQQTQQIGVWARVKSKSCHTSDSGGGAAWMSFKDASCVLGLSYRAPSGKAGTVTFHGVDDFRIHHDNSGHDVVKIYFSPGSDTAVNPQDRPPWWALLVIIGCVLVICGASAWGLLVGTSRAKVINRRAGEERARLKRRAEDECRARAAATSEYVGQPQQWATDPTGRHEYRYWNGSAWTEHVANGGRLGTDKHNVVPE